MIRSHSCPCIPTLDPTGWVPKSGEHELIPQPPKSFCPPLIQPLPQVGCPGQEDVIRSYSCLPYTWDEPSAPSPRLAVELPGGRQLGTFRLDQVSARGLCEDRTLV